MKPARPCCRLAAVLLPAATAFAVLAPVPARAKPALPELPVHSELTLGAELGSLLDYARARNPAYAAAQAENRALDARATAAGRWPDPRLRVELMDMTRMGTQNLNLLPGRVGSTRYLWMQEIPWWARTRSNKRLPEVRPKPHTTARKLREGISPPASRPALPSVTRCIKACN